MEQFDTDEKLINSNKKNKRHKSSITFRQLILIIICCLISLSAIYFIFNKSKTGSNSVIPNLGKGN